MISRNDFYFLCLISRKIYLLRLFRLQFKLSVLCTHVSLQIIYPFTKLPDHFHGPLIKKSWNLRVAWDWEQRREEWYHLIHSCLLLFQIQYIEDEQLSGFISKYNDINWHTSFSVHQDLCCLILQPINETWLKCKKF